uniref:Germinal-center associated nuclear protein n=1 Tax=Monopterus albus TaxID=43700 RepID=A0A3Q3QX71_MONAL
MNPSNPFGTPAFGQQPAQPQTLPTISQPPAFGQPSLGISSSGFGGSTSSGFGNSQMISGSTTALGQPQPLRFGGQPAFGQQSSTIVTTGSRAFGSSEFSFKPANEVLFKPIFSASPEPANPQTTSLSSSPFSNSGSQTSSSTMSSSTTTTTTTGFSLLSTKPGLPGFSFSHFTTKALQPQTKPFFGGTNFGQPSAFDDNKIKAEASTDEKGSDLEASGDTNIFARFSKGTKRKDDPAAPSSDTESPAAGQDVPAEADSPRHPPKRPLTRSRGPPAGLFGRALSGLRRENANPVRREATKGIQQLASNWEETERNDVQAESDSVTATPSMLKTAARVKRGVCRESSESLSGLSPTDCTTIHCKDLLADLNKKEILEKHFARFGKVTRVVCRPTKSQATVHFSDHASAAKAKKKGKVLHRQNLNLFWQRKKQSKYNSSLKSLDLDREPQRGGNTETQSSEQQVPSSLLHLIGQLAETAEEKYRLLEQRDKVLRQGRPRRTDLDLSKVFVGTCPDMCPEKERYMRETRNQLSIFEVIPDTEMVDHIAAIKEYSRSSADQEEPLPHELRPLPVLSMTMDYLVTQIMEQGHDNYRDWYDFVWNRTRGIRKDITQQRLCCPHTVSLIEKCTRFHVHCAHHLCEEPMSSFDAKINNENMTKCLQSLKEMYQDLGMRQIYCPREAEFRQYSVLLKLNDSDILREAQQFRDEVRNSPEVKFAVHAFAAVNSNNFVRFFKLVKGASYLASCLLHRYFSQVRKRALKTLNMAHTVGPRSTAFPLEDIVRMLMFRNRAEATDFIQQYGLNVIDGMVELSRSTYQEPELPLSQKKSEVILAKKTVLLGEVVNGGPLPNPPQHTPTCSFDSQNKYRGEGSLAEPTSNPFKCTGSIIHFLTLSNTVESLVSEVLAQMLQEVSSDEIEMEQERVAEEKRKLEETRLAVNEKAERVAKCTEQVCTSLVEDTLDTDIARLVEEILDAELQCIHKYIKRWRDVVAVRRQLKRQMRGFPAAPCCVDPSFKLKALAPSAPAQPTIADLARGLVNLGNAGTLALSSSRYVHLSLVLREAIHQMRVHYYYQQLLDEVVWAPLDLPALVAENIPNPPDRIFWKAVLLLPSDHESVASLADSLSKIEECYELQGTGALVMLLPALSIIEPGRNEQDVPLLSALLQLKQLQQASTWHCPLPLVILVPGPDSLIQAMRWLLARAPPHFPLICQTLVQLVESSLSRDFSPRVYSHRQERATACLPSQDPAPVIQLYNAVLAHIADKVSSQDLCRFSWPPSEFCLPDTRDFVPHLGWNSAQHLAWLHKAILSLQLPQWEQLSNTDTWPELCSSISRYAAQIPVSHRSQPLLMSQLENLLERVRLNSLHNRAPRSKVTMGCCCSGGECVCPAYSQIPWDDVLVICIDHKLKDWWIPGPPPCEGEAILVEKDGEILVYFTTESLNDFQPPEEWTQDPDDLSEKEDWPKTTPVSMAQRLKQLEQQILTSQEEELTCRLKLSSLLSIVDD